MKVTDLVVVLPALAGVGIAFLGLLQLNPRIRNREGRASVSTSHPGLVAAGLVVAGIFLVMLAIGFFSD